MLARLFHSQDGSPDVNACLGAPFRFSRSRCARAGPAGTQSKGWILRLWADTDHMGCRPPAWITAVPSPTGPQFCIPAAGDNECGVRSEGLWPIWEAWARRGSPQHLVDTIKHGYTPPLATFPPPRHLANYKSATVTHLPQILLELSRLRSIGKLEGPLPYRPWLVHPLGGAPKKDSDKVRATVDATQVGLNACTMSFPTHFDGLEAAIAKLRPGCWMARIDLSDAFLHWPIAQEFCDLFGVQHPATGEYFRYRYVNFGWKEAPHLHNMFADELVRIIALPSRSGGADRLVIMYSDDIFLVGDSADSCGIPEVMSVLSDLGLRVNPAKILGPSQCLEFLGVELDSVRARARVSDSKVAKTLTMLNEFLAQHGAGTQVPRRSVARVAGKLSWLAPVVTGGRTHLRQVFTAMAPGPLAPGQSLRSLWTAAAPCTLSAAAVSDLSWWRDNLETSNGVTLNLVAGSADHGAWKGVVPFDDLTLDQCTFVPGTDIPVFTTDAAGTLGCGGFWGPDGFQTRWDPAQFELHITYKELWAIFVGLRRWGPQWRGRRVLVRTDSSAAMAAVNKGTSPSPALMRLIYLIKEQELLFDISLRARHIPGVVNVRADGLSRFSTETPSPWPAPPMQPQWSQLEQEFSIVHTGRILSHDETLSFCSSAVGDEDDLLLWPASSADATDCVAHFLNSRKASPRARATVVVPAMESEPWFRWLRGFTVLGCKLAPSTDSESCSAHESTQMLILRSPD